MRVGFLLCGIVVVVLDSGPAHASIDDFPGGSIGFELSTTQKALIVGIVGSVLTTAVLGVVDIADWQLGDNYTSPTYSIVEKVLGGVTILDWLLVIQMGGISPIIDIVSFPIVLLGGAVLEHGITASDPPKNISFFVGPQSMDVAFSF